MIFFDVTKSASAGHRSGLTRVSLRLRDELGTAATPVAWPRWDRTAAPSDWFLTAELFSEAERPGFRDFLRRRPCRCAAIFYDAIPLRYPHITWPRSVARHPEYLKNLAEFDRIWAISEASRTDLLGFWRWQGIDRPPPVDLLRLGADSVKGERRKARGGNATDGKRAILCVGILEPRKNQAFLLDVCAELWGEGLEFDLHLVGRVNPHFGGPITAKIKELRRRWPGLHHHAAADDAELARLFAAARATVFPTLAEGAGLPLLESLWQGVPCLYSDLPVLRENERSGGLPIPLNDAVAWKAALRAILTDDGLHARLAAEAAACTLPTWADAARILRGQVADIAVYRNIRDLTP